MYFRYEKRADIYLSTDLQAPVCRSGHSALAVGSNLVIFGGCNYRPLVDVSVLHTSSLTWSTPKLTTPQRGRMRPALQVEGGELRTFVDLTKKKK